MSRLAVLCFILLMLGRPAVAEDSPSPPPPGDSLPAAPADSAQVADSLAAPQLGTLEDSIKYIYPDVQLDTLNEAQRTLLEFETRYRLKMRDQERAEIKKVEAPFSYFDTISNWMISPRWNLLKDIDRSFYHDAGDYFKFDPSYVVTDYQVTPMRKTVQPYGLKGNRLAVLDDGYDLAPFEHTLEPDGMIDMNDIPTALDNEVVILPGPIGMVFGADHSAATLLTRPKRPDATTPESAFLVDKGSYAYSYARGRYSKIFTGGREIDMSLGYRNADGFAPTRSDDAYHQWGDVFFPFSQRFAVEASGWLYDRKGSFIVRPTAGGSAVERNRIDRRGRVAFVLHNSEHSVRNQFTYTHLRQTSSLAGNYDARFEKTGHAIALKREWISGNTAFRAEAGADWLKFDDWTTAEERYTGVASLSLVHRSDSYRFAANLRNRYVESYRMQPEASAFVSRETEKLYLYASAGYSERAPSLHELNLRFQEARIYGSAFDDYADEGNPNLKSEKLMTGALGVEVGSFTTSLALSAVGGRIKDGIDWIHHQDGDLTIFSPVNNDIDFATGTANARLAISDLFAFRGGGSYHWIDYKDFDNSAYTPEYQAFAGAELHVFWSQKLIHFYAYGEMQYVGPYDGFVKTGLGDEVVLNGKLSFRMGDFRFHWVVQNMLTSNYSAREYFPTIGRYNYYGFTWDFLN